MVVATDAVLTKAQAKRLAVMAQSGLSRAIYPVHSPLDGDVLFAAATARRPLPDTVVALTELGALAANVVARAIARGVYAAAVMARLDAKLAGSIRPLTQPVIDFVAVNPPRKPQPHSPPSATLFLLTRCPIAPSLCEA